MDRTNAPAGNPRRGVSLFCGLCLFAALLASAPVAGQSASRDAEVDTAPWQRVLGRFATADGGLRYAALRSDEQGRADLARFVTAIGRADVSGLSRDARIAFYANAYNALVVSSVIERWPVESVIRENGFFDRATRAVAGRRLTLNQLENDVLRRFGEPRVHFLISCASAGCPPLSRDAITRESLEAQLAARARAFVRASTRVDRAHHRVALSQIFEWYDADFATAGGVRAFVAGQLDASDAAVVSDPRTTIVYTPYDWALNARP